MRAYKDRKEAGEKLASLLQDYAKKKDTLVIGLPRGGVVTAAVVANRLHLPLDIIVPRKLGAPFNAEYAIGAIAGEELFLETRVIKDLQIPEDYLKQEIEKQKKEAERRRLLFRKNRKPIPFKNKTILLVDDGIATGATMKASILFLKKQKVKTIVVAVPVAPKDTYQNIQKIVDSFICPRVEENFFGVSDFYDFFEQTSDAEVVELLNRKP